MAKYKEAMDRIEVSEEMQSRILRNVDQHFSQKDRRKKRRMLWIPTLGALAAAVLLVVLIQPWKNRTEVSSTEAGTTANSGELPGGTEPTEDLATGGIYTVTEHASVQELSQAVGFPVKELSSFTEAPQETAIQDISGTVAEINYNGTRGSICYRMSKGTEDNSGIYDVFPKTTVKEVKGCKVTLKGDTGKVTLAVWNDGNYSYSIYCIPGITEDEILAFVSDTL